jgi:cytochrome d ubiquinol oxidase subunit I
MQTPVGYAVVEGRFVPQDWVQIVFSPSFPFRFAHTVTAFYISTGFVVLGVAGYYLRKRRHLPEARRMVTMALPFLSVMVPLQIVLGDAHGVNTLQHQPAKIAAMEGLWETQARAPAVLFAIPDATAETNHFEIAIPGLASVYLTHHIEGKVRGLKSFPAQDRPPVAPVFFAFRIMVGIGVLMLGVVVWGMWLWRSERLEQAALYHWVANLMLPAGFVAVIAGWVVTEVGRQPWTVYGLLRTADSVTRSVTGVDVVLSLLLYIVVYAVVYAAGGLYLWRLIKAGPTPLETPRDAALYERPARPLSVMESAPLAGEDHVA